MCDDLVWASTVPEYPGRYLISGAWSRVPEDLHKFVLFAPECGPPWPAHVSDMKTCMQECCHNKVEMGVVYKLGHGMWVWFIH